jgi:hypothetical protein
MGTMLPAHPSGSQSSHLDKGHKKNTGKGVFFCQRVDQNQQVHEQRIFTVAKTCFLSPSLPRNVPVIPSAEKDDKTRVNPTMKKTWAATWIGNIWKHAALGWWFSAFSNLQLSPPKKKR